MEIKTSFLTKLLNILVLLGMIFLGGLLLFLPFLVTRYFNFFSLLGLDSSSKVLIILFLYATGILLFIILFMSKKLCKNIIELNPFSYGSIRALKVICLCAFFASIMYLVATLFNYHSVIALLTFIISAASFLLSLIAAILNRLVHLAVEIKSENDLTI